MKTLTVSTPTGKQVNISYDNGNYTISVPQAKINVTQSSCRLHKSYRVKQLNDNYPAIIIDGNFIALDKNDYQTVRDFECSIDAETEQSRVAKIDAAIPGYSELLAAYNYRSEQIDIYQQFMERAVRTSIGSGDAGDVKNAEANVNELEQKYDRAKMYIKWSNGNPECSSGYQARVAADALLNGASIEDATAISNNYDALAN